MTRNTLITLLDMELGHRVQSLREKLGLSQEDLAARAGTTSFFIAGLECGGDIGASFLEKVARALDVPVEELRAPRK